MRFIPKLFLSGITIFFPIISCTSINLTGSFYEYLNGQINKMTYDQALINYGEPSSTFNGDEIFIVTWGAENLGGAVFPVGNVWLALPIKKGWKLQLLFNKKTRKMVDWKYESW